MPRIYLVILLVLSTASNAQSTIRSVTDLAEASFANRSLRNLLHLYQRQGMDIVFSDAVVTKDLIVWRSPASNEPMIRLATLLDTFALMLEYDQVTNTYYVVKDDINTKRIFIQIDNPEQIPCEPKVWINKSLRPYQIEVGKRMSLFLPPDTSEIQIECEGFNKIRLEKSQIDEQLSILFTGSTHITEEIVVTGTQFAIREQGSQSHKVFNRVQLNTEPLRGGDPIQIINSLPGMSTSGVSAKPFIQGGAANELLILIDGIELIDPFHLKDFYSLYSGINPDTIDQVDFYKGIYPARLGGKMSAAIDITTKSDVDDYRHSIGVNAYTSSFQVSGKAQSDSIYWNVHGRRGNLSDILNRVNPELGSPRFSDTYFKVRWEKDDRNIFDIGGLTLYDNISLRREETQLTEEAESRYENNYGWLRWNHLTNNETEHELVLSSANIKNKRNGVLNNTDTFSGSIGALNDEKDYDLTRFKYDAIIPLRNSQTVSIGANIDYAYSNYRYSAHAELGNIASALGYPNILEQEQTQDVNSLSGASYVSLSQEFNQHLKIEVGARHDWQDSSVFRSDQLSPRLRTTVKVSPKSTIEFSYGRYHQHPAITELSLDGKTPLSYSPQKSDHVYLNWQQEPSPSLSYSVGGYYKYIYNPRPRAESLLTQFHFLPELVADSFSVTPDFSQLRGIELAIKYRHGNILTQGNYSYNVHKDYEGSRTYQRRWGQRHTLNVQVSWKAKRLEVSGKVLWHSGWRFTDLKPEDLNPSFDVFQHYNRQTLPNYFTMDLSASYNIQLKNSLLKIDANITNASDYNNIGSYTYTTAPSSTTDELSLEKTPDSLLPILPSIGIKWLF